MAAAETELTLKITADQAGAVKALLDLGNKLEQMGTELEAVKAKSKALETAWETVGQQADKLGMQIALGKQQLKELSSQGISKTHVEYQALKAEIKENESALKRLTPALNQAEREFKQQASAVDKLDAKLKQNTATYNANRTARRQSGVDVDHLRGEFARLTSSAEKSAAALRTQAAAAKTSSESAVGLGTSIRNTIATMAGMAAAYLGLQQLKEGIMSVISTGGKFESLNVSLKTVMGSAEAGEQAFAWIQKFAEATPLEIDGVTQAFIKLKAFGMDPMDGTLQKLTDQNAKMNGTQEQLLGMVLAVGQAWTKQKLMAQDANQMLERGIPVWDMLGKVMGKTGAEVMKMSEKGQIGRREIKLLIDEMGKSSEGAAAAQMKTWTGIVSNLSDNWTKFLNTIAKSGALDFMKSKLTELNKAFADMQASGELQAWAQKISKAMTDAGQSVVNAGKTVKDNIGGIITALETLAIALGAKLAVSLAASAANLVKWGTALVALAGGPVTVLLTALGLLGLAFVKLGSSIDDYYQRQRMAKDATEDAALAHAELAKKVQETLDANERYAKAAIVSQGELSRMTVEQAAAYRQALEGAQKYWDGRAAAARLAHNQDGMAEATAMADAYAKRLEEAIPIIDRMAQNQKVFNEATKDGTAAVQQFTAESPKLEEFSKALKAMADNTKDADKEWKKFADDMTDADLVAVIDEAKQKMAEFAPIIGKNSQQMKEWQAVIEAALGETITRAGGNAGLALRGVSDEIEKGIEKTNAMQQALTASGMEAQKAAKITLDALTAMIPKAKATGDLQAIGAELTKLGQGVAAGTPLFHGLTDAHLKLFEAQRGLKTGSGELAQSLAQSAASASSLAQKIKEGTATAGDYAAANKDAASANQMQAAAADKAAESTGKLTTSQQAANIVAGEKQVHNNQMAAQNQKNAADAHAQAVASTQDAKDGIVQIESMTIGMESRTVAMNAYGEATRKTYEVWNNHDFGTYENFMRAQDEWLRQAKEQVIYSGTLITELDLATESGIGLDSAIRKAQNKFDKLDDATLAGLNAAIDAAKNKMLELEASTRSTLNSLKDELDQLEGNTKSIEERRYQAQQESLRLQAEQAKGNAEADANARESLRIADEIHRKKMAEISSKSSPASQAQSPTASRTEQVVRHQFEIGGKQLPVDVTPSTSGNVFAVLNELRKAKTSMN